MPTVQITHSVELPVELTSPPESTFFSKVWCTAQWSRSGFVLFALITPKGTSMRLCWLTEQNPQQRTFPTLSLFVLQSPFKFWTWMMFCRYWWWHSSYVADIYDLYILVLGSSLNDRESSRDKANMGNHKANRGFLPSTVNRSSAVCSVLTRTPISSYWDAAPSY